MILSQLRQLIQDGAHSVLQDKKSGTAVPLFDLSIPPGKIGGDMAANVALMVAKEVGVPPRELAETIIKKISQSTLLKKIDIAGPGFINFVFTDAALRSEVELFLKKEKGPFQHPDITKKILIEFVSANPTGPLHVGHGRGAALGDSLVRIFRYMGADVTSEYYINDAGGQIRNLGLSLEARLNEVQGKPFNFPEGGYKGDYVVQLAKELDSKKQTLKPVTSAQMVFDETDYSGFASARILTIIKKSLLDFGITFDSWSSETDLHKKSAVPHTFKELKKKNLTYESEGALWFKATEFGDEKDRVLQKANEAPTYFASDIAYHQEKLERKYERLVNIWGADHHGYAQRLKGALRALNGDDSYLQVIFNQMISVKGGRMSKRAGDVVMLSDLVTEVGKDAARFFFALRSPGSHFEFDLDLAKKQAPDNPVFYVQYVHARCCSIFEEAKKRGYESSSLVWKKAKEIADLHDSERAVILHLMNFDVVVEICARDYSNHHMTVYLLELAGKFHSFYENCYVLDEDENLRSFRLDLIEAIRLRVAQGLDLLGVGAPVKL